MDTQYISRGNSKLGKFVFSFDLPAKKTCIGMSKECEEKCYAWRLMQVYPNVDKKYSRNLDFSLSEDFTDYMIETIPVNCEFRPHVSGDFYSVEYVRKWIEICSSRQDVQFYCYTRSWTNPKIWKELVKLSELDNVTVNLSLDSEMSKPRGKKKESLRWAYLTNDDNVPNWLRKDDIIFRSNHIGHKKRRKNAVKKGENPPPLIHNINGVRVCPLERGQDITGFSCSKCQICVVKPKCLV